MPDESDVGLIPSGELCWDVAGRLESCPMASGLEMVVAVEKLRGVSWLSGPVSLFSILKVSTRGGRSIEGPADGSTGRVFRSLRVSALEEDMRQVLSDGPLAYSRLLY